MKGTTMNEVRDELELPLAQHLLTRATLARLAYLGPDALPRVVPLGFFWNGTAVVICTATTSPKVAALRRRPQVALVIDAGDTPATARSVSIRGSAELEIVDGVPPEYLAGARKVMDEQAAAEFEQGVSAFYDRMARISITPQWARCYDFGAGRLPRFLTEMAEAANT
jgi:hypothetical protein